MTAHKVRLIPLSERLSAACSSLSSCLPFTAQSGKGGAHPGKEGARADLGIP